MIAKLQQENCGEFTARTDENSKVGRCPCPVLSALDSTTAKAFNMTSCADV